MLLLTISALLSCGSRTQSKEEIQEKIDDLHSRISVLEEEIPRLRGNIQDGTFTDYQSQENLQTMEQSLHDYRIQLDELNRQLVNAK